jgi:hypothetical protein
MKYFVFKPLLGISEPYYDEATIEAENEDEAWSKLSQEALTDEGVILDKDDYVIASVYEE